MCSFEWKRRSALTPSEVRRAAREFYYIRWFVVFWLRFLAEGLYKLVHKLGEFAVFSSFSLSKHAAMIMNIPYRLYFCNQLRSTC